MPTPITAESVFDAHAVALGMPTIGDQSIDAYIAGIKTSHLSLPKSTEVDRQLRAAFDAAKLMDHGACESGLYQARNIQNNPYPPQFGA
jgi:hypothetical protein